MKGQTMALRAAFLATAIMSGLFANAEAQQPADVIPDTATALKVGTAILEARYGELFRKGLPYKAVLVGDEWDIVSEGSPGEIKFGGGMPELSMSRKDGRVTHIQLSR